MYVYDPEYDAPEDMTEIPMPTCEGSVVSVTSNVEDQVFRCEDCGHTFECEDTDVSCPLCPDILLDTSDLSGDSTPISLEDFIEINEESPLSSEEVDALRALKVGESAHLGIGGGSVAITRVR